MSGFDANEMVSALLGGLSKMGETLNVIREPIQAGDKLIIPAVVARMGVGAGGGSGRRAGHGDGGEGGRDVGSGGGGGGGLMLSPVFLIVDAAGERLITVPNAVSATSEAIETLARAAGDMFSRARDGKARSSETP